MKSIGKIISSFSKKSENVNQYGNYKLRTNADFKSDGSTRQIAL
jgi:hypothetical protein